VRQNRANFGIGTLGPPVKSAVKHFAPGIGNLLAKRAVLPMADKAREFEREMDVIRGSIRRMDRIAAAEEAMRPRAAE